MMHARSFICKINDSCLLSRRQHHVKSTTASGEHSKTMKENNALQLFVQPTKNIPGPKALPLLGNWFRFIPYIGQYGAYDVITQLRMLRDRYGDIVKLDSLMNRRSCILLFSPELCEKMYRMEGKWPMRIGMESLHYYRKNREDVYGKQYGLATSQGKMWHDFRSKVDPYMMEPRTIKAHITQISDISYEFVEKMRALRDPMSPWELPADFRNELYKWSLESICSIALDCRLGCLKSNLAADSEPQIMINCVHDLFDLVYRLDILPSLWKIYNTRNLKKLFRVVDTLNRIASKHIEQAEAKLRETTVDDTNLHDRSILEKLLRLDKQMARVMALDMLTAGIDTTGNVAGAMLYYIASNPEKQDKLLLEVLSVLPEKTSPITYEILNRTRYTKACIKESLRLLPIIIGNLRTMQTDVCIGGYKIPAGFDVVACHSLIATEPTQFPQPQEYIPERWLRGDTEFPSAKQAHSFAYMPFGFGPRSCVGQRFAMMELEILLMKVIRNFWIEWHHGPLKYESRILNRIASPMQFRLFEL
ncbi:Probable cytochrome P450 49a1 [Camponotus japonicus]